MQLSQRRALRLAPNSPAFDISVAGGACWAIAATFSACWLLILLAAIWGGWPDSMAGVLSLLWPSQTVMILFSAVIMQSGMAEAQQVLRARIAPTHALRASLAALRRQSWQIWALSALPLLLDSGSRLAQAEPASFSAAQALMQLAAGPAWLALLLASCAGLMAAWQGRLKAPAGLATLAAALLLWQPEGAPALLSGSLGTAPALLFQILVLLIAPRAFALALGQAQGQGSGAWPWLREKGQAWASQFGLLDKSAQAAHWLPAQIVWFSVLSQSWMGQIFWTKQPSLGGYGLRLLMLCVLALFSLQCHWLHWRHLIAPRNAVRIQLGRHILLDTLRAYLRSLPLLGLLAGISLTVYLLATPEASLGGTLVQIGPIALWLALDMTLAIVLAVLLRGSLRSQQLALLALVVPLAMGLLALLWAPSRSLLDQTFARDGLWLALELGLILALLPLLSRAWRGVDLGALMQRNETALAKRRQTLGH